MKQKNILDKQNIESFIGREIESKPENQAGIFLLLFIVNIIAVGVFGVFKGYKAYNEKRVLLREYEEIEQNLQTNIDTINSIEPYIENNKGLDFIGEAIPANPNNASFLQEVARVFSRNGFIFERMQLVNEGNATAITANVEGRFSDLPDLLQDMEAMTRIVSIQQVNATPIKSTSVENLRIVITFDIFRVPL